MQWGLLGGFFGFYFFVFRPLLEQHTLPPSDIWFLVHYSVRAQVSRGGVTGIWGSWVPCEGTGPTCPIGDPQDGGAVWQSGSCCDLLSCLAVLRGGLLVDICAVALWASPATFSRFSRVNVATPHPSAVVLQPEPSGPTHTDPTHTDPTLLTFIRHSVLETPPLVVSRDESEWRVTNVTRLLWIPHDRQSSLLTILMMLLRRFCGKASWNDNGR